MNPMSVQRDERTVAVENASYRWGYLLMSFGVLVSVAYRSFARGESNWDLLALVVLGGLVPNVYQGANHVLTRRWALASVVTLVAAAIVAAIVTFVGR
ncbi:MAG: hypothetical protein JJE40_17250 [Vicinamibacteria bacterium]|nr:hypothetical protein [Vicinamibacteria bacterium]